eukprot:c41815_g1_i1 orf=2-235(-)
MARVRLGKRHYCYSNDRRTSYELVASKDDSTALYLTTEIKLHIQWKSVHAMERVYAHVGVVGWCVHFVEDITMTSPLA